MSDELRPALQHRVMPIFLRLSFVVLYGSSSVHCDVSATIQPALYVLLDSAHDCMRELLL